MGVQSHVREARRIGAPLHLCAKETWTEATGMGRRVAAERQPLGSRAESHACPCTDLLQRGSHEPG